MRYIARAGLAISLAQMETYLTKGGNVPHDAVLVTVDDGFRSLRTHALPILAEYAIPAVAFVSAGLTATKRGDAATNTAPEDYLDWDDLAALVAAGISVQSHGWSHRSLGRLTRDEVQEDLSRSKDVLQSRLGTHVTAFAYPFGTRADFSSEIAVAVSVAGYRLAFTSQHGSIRPGDPPFTLARTKVESGENLSTFASVVHGGLDAWRWVDRGLWYLQSSRTTGSILQPSGRGAGDSHKPA
jgi:peptidoglycan/xylan/chitin deacetylase (PgdA/CDA1 family)